MPRDFPSRPLASRRSDIFSYGKYDEQTQELKEILNAEKQELEKNGDRLVLATTGSTAGSRDREGTTERPASSVPKSVARL